MQSAEEALDDAPFGSISFDDDGRVISANRFALELLGFQRDELVGTPLERVLTMGARIFFQTHLFPLISLHGRAEEIYLILQASDGERVGVLLNAVRRERASAGAVNECAFMRVRERERFEQELLLARRAADEARLLAEARSQELEVANEMLHEAATELEAQQDLLRDQALEMEMQADELQAANARLNERGEELERQRRSADEANRAKSHFLATMSHELRTPLNAIGGYTQLLDMGIHGPVTEAQQVALGRIERSQRHLLRLINDVLNLSRIESGRVEYVIEEIHLAELVAAVEPMVEPQIAAKGIEFRMEVASGEIALADLEKVQQVLLNLLGNAVKFTPPGGRITVSVHSREDRPELIFLQVSDTGPGIPASMLDSIFEPFVQVESSPERREGTGLGLAISRDLARGMGGDLRARSVEGKGAAFTLSLPRAAEHPGDPTG